MKKYIFFALSSIFCLLLSTETSAQDRGEGFGEIAVCVYPVSGMRLQPGKNAQYLEPIRYGQEVQLLGDTAYVPSEARVYIRVQSQSGKVGWVHRYLFEMYATQVVVTRNAQIYGSPGAVTTITTAEFSAGELAAMSDFQEDWILLVGKEKQKKGWIRRSGGVEPISVADNDLAIAALVETAMSEPNVTARINSLEAIQQQPNFSKSPLKSVVINKIEEQVDIANQADQAVTEGSQNRLANNNTNQQTPEQTTSVLDNTTHQRLAHSINPNRSEEAVYDENTGQNYTKVTEKGTVYVVKGPENAESIYFAYHKDLPKGAKVLLNIPDNSGFVELEVINKLSKSRSQVIGLSEATLEAVFGEGVKDPQVEVVYFIKR